MGWLGNILKGVVGSIPIVGGIAKTAIDLGESIFAHKQPINNAKQLSILPPPPPMTFTSYDAAHLSPVMPGGGVATPSGVVGQMDNPPRSYAHRSSRRTKRRSSSSSRSHSTKRRSRKKGRKLKFGSPAYRKKYLGHR